MIDWLVGWLENGGENGAMGLYDKRWIELYYEEIILSLGWVDRMGDYRPRGWVGWLNSIGRA